MQGLCPVYLCNRIQIHKKKNIIHVTFPRYQYVSSKKVRCFRQAGVCEGKTLGVFVFSNPGGFLRFPLFCGVKGTRLSLVLAWRILRFLMSTKERNILTFPRSSSYFCLWSMLLPIYCTPCKWRISVGLRSGWEGTSTSVGEGWIYYIFLRLAEWWTVGLVFFLLSA